MQLDMHYYGVYVLARAAGISGEGALRIARASQLVDDYTEEDDIETNDGALISYWPSGHGMICDDNFDVARLEKADPHKVWVPFHFLPGKEGPSYGECMKCRKDSPMARAVLDRVLSWKENACLPELAGVAAHLYADTFSHYGFSGLRCDGNIVDSKSIVLHVQNRDILKYITHKATRFLSSLAGSATRGLGHSCVADYPDRPYLKWEFTYEEGPESGLRDNQATYLAACEALFGFFTKVRAAAPRYAETTDTREFKNIRNGVAEIIAFEGKKEERADEWQKHAMAGTFLFSEKIPEYSEEFITDGLHAIQRKSAEEARSSEIWLFTHAIEIIRGMTLYELLPGEGLIG